MPSPAINTYDFGPYRIDSAQRLLHLGGDLVPLPPKVASTLIVLLENAGRLVAKDDLMKAVWPDTFVEEGALARNISLLRKALGDTGDVPLFIETIPRRGYRFVAPVNTTGGETAQPAASREIATVGRRPLARSVVLWSCVAALLLLGLGFTAGYLLLKPFPVPPAPPFASGSVLAVLPFRSLEAGPAQAYFAEGVTQALITRLSHFRNLRIVSFASDMGGGQEAAAWAEVRRNGSIARVLTGKVQRAGGRVRVDVQALDPATRAVDWAESYDRAADDALALESVLAEAIAGRVRVALSAGEVERLRRRRPVNPRAFDACLRGRYSWNRRTEESLKRAVEYFQEAIAADPAYAAAYAGLADAYSLLGSIGTDGLPPRQAMPLARTAAQKAIELDPDSAEGHTSLGYVLLSYDWDLPGAAREFGRALELNPASATARHWYSRYLMAAGQLDQAAIQMSEAHELEPLSSGISIGVGWCHYYSRRYDQAVEQFRSVTETDPTLPLAHVTLGMALQQKGKLDLALESYRRAASCSNRNPLSVALLSGAYAALGRPAEARQELARLHEMSRRRYVPALYFSAIHHALGDLTEAVSWGRKAYDERCDYLLYLGIEPRTGIQASHPVLTRFLTALRR